MRIAVLTDIHANREAFEACVAQARRHGAAHWVFLGDFVGYGADPQAVVDGVRALLAEGGVAVMGNHDHAVVDPTAGEHMNDDAKRVVDWTRARLDGEARAFLAGLPMTVEQDDRLYVHANAWEPPGWAYIAGTFDAARSLRATAARLTFCGHVHEPALYHQGADGRAAEFAPHPGMPVPLASPRRWLALPGSVGQPRDGLPAACWALYDTATRAMTWWRVPYDRAAAARKVREAGLPESLARRLERGA